MPTCRPTWIAFWLLRRSLQHFPIAWRKSIYVLWLLSKSRMPHVSWIDILFLEGFQNEKKLDENSVLMASISHPLLHQSVIINGEAWQITRVKHWQLDRMIILHAMSGVNYMISVQINGPTYLIIPLQRKLVLRMKDESVNSFARTGYRSSNQSYLSKTLKSY